jgi:hypothetical protein
MKTTAGLYFDWNWDSTFEAELAEHIPVVKATVAGTRLVGRLCVGMYLHVQPAHRYQNYKLLKLKCRCRQQEWSSYAPHDYRSRSGFLLVICATPAFLW